MSNYFILDFLLDGLLSLIDIISFAAIGSSIFVIINKNPIVSLFFLILLFGCISIYLMILGLTFMGLAYLIVYIGAVSILFLFILMLINIRISELQSNNANSLILSIIMSITFIYLISPLLPYNIKSFFFNFEFPDRFSYFFTKGNEWLNSLFQFNYYNNKEIYYVTGNFWDANLAETSHITSIGNIMYTNYNMWLIIASYILLLAMVGVIVITINPKN